MAIWFPEEKGRCLPSPFCTTMRRLKGLFLSCGTSLERIAPESLTQALFDFVHCHISGYRHRKPPNQVNFGLADRAIAALTVNPAADTEFAFVKPVISGI
jgi:hypothetical protein